MRYGDMLALIEGEVRAHNNGELPRVDALGSAAPSQ